MPTLSKAWPAATLCLLLAMAAASVAARAPAGPRPAAQPSPPPQAKPTPSLERQFFKNIVRDQKAIWVAPLHLHGPDAHWLGPRAWDF
jgi:hypothetical protein